MEKKYDATSLESTLTYIRDQYGIDSFLKKDRFIAYFSDLAPNLKNERSMLKRISALGIFEEIVRSQNDDKAIQERTIARALTTLIENEYIQEKIATEYLRILANVVGLKVTVPEPQEEAKKSEAPTQIKNQVVTSVSTHTTSQVKASSATTTKPINQVNNASQHGNQAHFTIRSRRPKPKKQSNLLLWCAVVLFAAIIWGRKIIVTKPTAELHVEPTPDVFPVAPVQDKTSFSYVSAVSNDENTVKSDLSTLKQTVATIAAKMQSQEPMDSSQAENDESSVQTEEIVVEIQGEPELTPDEQYNKAFQFYVPPNDTRKGIIPDNEEAFKWFLKAAEQGHKEAQFWVGHMYDFGEGVTQNHYKAVEWWEKSAAQGVPEAQFWLAYKYMLGQGVAKDEQKAFDLWRKASKNIPEARDELKKRGLYVPDDAKEFNGHYYKVFYETLSWHEAVRRCEAEGGYLCTITSEEEFNFVTKLLPTSKLFYWLGASDLDSEGRWRWITNEPFSFTRWRNGEPNGGKTENFLVLTNFWNKWLWNDGNKNDWPSASQYAFICEWSDKTKLPKVQSEPSSIYAAVIGNRVRIRYSHTVDSAELTKIVEGTPIEIIGSAKGDDGKTWFKVIYSDEKSKIEGWVHSDHVIMDRIGEVGKHGGKFKRVKGEDVNLRTEPFKPSNSALNRITYLQPGHLVEILEEQKVWDNKMKKNYIWYRVFTLKGEQGWVRGDNLQPK